MFSSNAGLLSAWNSGNESVAAQTYGTRFLVPAAFGTGPGSVVVYVGRAFGAFGLPPYVFTTLGNPDGMSRYYRFLQDAYVRGALVSQSSCDCDTSRPPICSKSEVHDFTQRRWTQALTAASETYSGGLSVTTYALVAPNQDLGEGDVRADHPLRWRQDLLNGANHEARPSARGTVLRRGELFGEAGTGRAARASGAARSARCTGATGHPGTTGTGRGWRVHLSQQPQLLQGSRHPARNPWKPGEGRRQMHRRRRDPDLRRLRQSFNRFRF